jgi:hypothetical protein
MDAGDPMSELQALTSKRSNFRDKLKKRREALGSILAQTTGGGGGAAVLTASPVKSALEIVSKEIKEPIEVKNGASEDKKAKLDFLPEPETVGS